MSWRDSPLSLFSTPCSPHSSSPCMGLERSVFKPCLTIIFLFAVSWGFFIQCHLCMSSPFVQLGSNAACSIFLWAPLTTRCYLQLWAVFTWLSPKMTHSLHLTAGSHLSVPPSGDMPGWTGHHTDTNNPSSQCTSWHIRNRWLFFFLSVEVPPLPCLRIVHLTLLEKPALIKGALCHISTTPSWSTQTGITEEKNLHLF